MPGTIEVVRPGGARRRHGARRRGRRRGRPSSCPPAARCAPQDLGLLAAAGVTEVLAPRAPARGDRVDRRRGRRPRHREARAPVRSATRRAVALAALVREAGGEPDPRGIVADDRDALAAVLRDAVASSDVVVVSAGSSVGARDETAAVVAGLGEPGIWAHGIAAAPRQADAAGRLRRRAGHRAAGQPALGAGRVPPAWGCRSCASSAASREPPPEPSARARLARDVPSAAGRLDIVQVTVRDGVATPLFGASALLSILTAADGYLVVARRGDGARRPAPRSTSRSTPRWPPRRSSATSRPPRRSPPGARRAPRPAAPPRVDAVRIGLHEAVGRVTAEPVWATRSSPSFDASAMDGIAVRAAETVGASESTPVLLEPDAYVVVDTGDPLPEGFDAVVMREHVHYDDAGRAELRGAVAPYQHVRSIGEDVSAAELLLPDGPPPAARSTSPPRRPPAPSTCSSAARPVVAVLPTGDEIRPVGTDPAPGRDPRHELADARRAGRGGRLRRRGGARSSPTTPTRSRAAVRDAAARADLVIVGRRVERRARRPHGRRSSSGSARWRSTAWPSGPGTRSCSAPSTPRPSSARPATRSRRR